MKATLTSIIIAVALIGGALVLTRNVNNTDVGQGTNANNVSLVDGRQIIEINAKGGYQPRKSIAKSGVPTIIRFNTNGTFDCSSAVRIPSLNLARALSPSGSTDIEVGIPTAGKLIGSCGMGMYRFEVEFQ